MTERYKHIEELLEHFLEGKTTKQEEQELYAFFEKEDIPAHLAAYKRMFAWFDEGLAGEVAALPGQEVSEIHPGRRFRIWGTVAAVAATVALILLVRPVPTPEKSGVYVESYIIRNGVKITDPAVVIPELEAAQAQWEAEERRRKVLLFYQMLDIEMDNLLQEDRINKNFSEALNVCFEEQNT